MSILLFVDPLELLSQRLILDMIEINGEFGNDRLCRNAIFVQNVRSFSFEITKIS